MRIAIGADHAGFLLKQDLKAFLDDRGVASTDFGTHSTDSVDYPDIAATVAHQVAQGEFDLGLLVCGSGVGMAIAANKIPGIRAASVTSADAARLSREHNDANILALGERLTPAVEARRIVAAFLDAAFEGGRHQRRVDKIGALDARPSS
jgi:ribose 5-phosphate isomerase B